MDKQPSDISEAALNEARLEVLARLSESLSHDLRTPLTVIRNALYFLRRSAPATPEITESIEMIADEVGELNLVLQCLMEVTHGFELERREVELKPLLSEAIARADGNAAAVWRLDLEGQPSAVWCDPARFRLVLCNLFRNSLTAMRGRGEIHVTARPDSDGYVIEVRDTGPGVPEEVRERLFEPFVTTKRTGMGLGLTYCREIMSRHNGSIALIESSPRGAAFRLLLPPRSS